MKGPIATTFTAAHRLMVPVTFAIALSVAPAVPAVVAGTVADSTTPAASASASGLALNRHGGGIYKHLWLDEIGPHVYVPHVDTTVHQSR